MAIRFVNATCATSTSATNCKKAEAANLTAPFSGNTYDDTNTARTSGTFQVTNGVSLQGAFIPLRIGASPSGTYTVYLMEGATQRAVSASTNVTTLGNGTGFIYVTFGTPYTAASGINYSIKVTSWVAAKCYWWRSSTAGDYQDAVIGNGPGPTG